MSNYELRDERGVAMLLELVLIAGVLGLVGLALWQSNHHTKDSASLVNQKAVPAVVTQADDAAKQIQTDATADDSLSAEAESTGVSDFAGVDDDVTNLGDSFNESNF
jgi:hypothetical protein